MKLLIFVINGIKPLTFDKLGKQGIRCLRAKSDLMLISVTSWQKIVNKKMDWLKLTPVTLLLADRKKYKYITYKERHGNKVVALFVCNVINSNYFTALLTLIFSPINFSISLK